MIFGYNQASAGNILTLPSFYTRFPQMDTGTTQPLTNLTSDKDISNILLVTSTGAEENHKATIQGALELIKINAA
jgi:hypothetical protein